MGGKQEEMAEKDVMMEGERGVEREGEWRVQQVV